MSEEIRSNTLLRILRSLDPAIEAVQGQSSLPPSLLGLVGVDYSRYPSEPQQKVWIRTYLEESAKIKGNVLHCRESIHVHVTPYNKQSKL